MSTIEVTAAAAELTRLVDAVERGEKVTLTRHGKPVAALVRPGNRQDPGLDALHAGAEEIRRLLESGRHRPLPFEEGLAPGRADELVAELRADRDAR